MPSNAISLFQDAEARGGVIDQVASEIGADATIIEKDLWVCWTLARLHEIPGMPRITFKGGTSLSKVHRLIDRLSEDIDLTFSRDGWGFVGDRDPLGEGLSGKQREKLKDEVSLRAASIVRGVVLPALRDACATHLRGRWSVEVDEDVADKQTLNLYYPTARSYAYTKPLVIMEFGARGEPWPTAVHRVRSMVEETYEGGAPETVCGGVETLAPERTFWEKATLLHELHRRSLTSSPSTFRQSRHLYDLHRMWAPLRERLMGDPQLLRSVVRNKMVFFTRPAAEYPLVLARHLCSTPHRALEAGLRDDYDAMRGAMFFPGTAVPTFEATLATLREIDAAVANWTAL